MYCTLGLETVSGSLEKSGERRLEVILEEFPNPITFLRPPGIRCDRRSILGNSQPILGKSGWSWINQGEKRIFISAVGNFGCRWFNLSTDSLLPPVHPLYCIHYQLAPPLMSQTRVIDLSAINKNLSIRFRAKFGKQSEGSISNYLRAISLARIYPIIWHQQELLPKKVKGEGSLCSENLITDITLIIYDQKMWSVW